jgi:ketosteroid isomerase-like protein
MTEPTTVATEPGPREIFARMQQQWLGGAAEAMGSLLADDVVIETPYAPPGRPRRFQGRDEWLAFARAARAATPPLRFDECRNVVVHETTDPEVIVVEYELAGTVTTTNVHAAACFIGVLRVRDGRIAHWREYQNVLAIARALGQLPALLAGYGGDQPESVPEATKY